MRFAASLPKYVRRALDWGALSTQIFTLLMLGLVLTQVIAFGLIHAAGERETRARMLAFMAADAVLIYQVFQQLPPQDRYQWVPWFNRGFYVISLRSMSELEENVPRGLFPRLDQMADAVAKRLQHDDVRLVWEGREPALVLPLTGGGVVSMLAYDPLPSPSLKLRIGYFALLLAVAAINSWIIIRILMRPLERFFAVTRALGENIRAEPAPEEGPREVRQVIHIINNMQARIQRQMTEEAQILASISHDLRTPITRLRLRTDLINDADMRQKFAADLDAVSEMISEGLEHARSARLVEKRAPVDLTALVESIADQMADLGHLVSVEGRIQRPYPAALRAMERAICNLVTNAVKFGGRAHLLLEESDEAAIIRVTDPGPGVPPQLLEQVFEPYFRVGSSRNRENGGIGLGLAIARNLVRAHAGDISLNNRPDGFEAVVKLPWGPCEA